LRISGSTGCCSRFPTSEHEHEHKSEYLATLACYFRENNSPQRASRLLHVHPNTVAYRIKRIEEITGLKLDNYRDRLIAQVALEILDALPEQPAPSGGPQHAHPSREHA
jgi:DNA-binding PucR family transcriptional regulator